MFIVWGTKIKRKVLGRVADFCPICHKARAHVLRRIGEASHVYYISFGQGTLLGHETECETCHVRRETEEQQYAAISRDKFGDVNALLAETHPDFERYFAERLAREAKLAAGTLSDEEREEMLWEPFVLIGSMLEANRAEPESSPLARKIGWTTLAVGAVLVAAAIYRPRPTPETYENFLVALAAVLAIGLVASFALMFFRSPWFMKHRVRPMLVRALLPLKPTLAELEETIDSCRQSELRIGKKIKPNKLHAWLEEASMLVPRRSDGLSSSR